VRLLKLRREALCVAALLIVAPLFGQNVDLANEAAWSRVLTLAEDFIGSGAVAGEVASFDRIDLLVDLHARFSSDVLGRPVSSERIAVTKQAFRLVLQTLPQRYSGDRSSAMLRLLRDLVTNRAFFVELLSSDDPAEVIQEQILAYLERNGSMSYTEPVPIPDQVAVPRSDTMLGIVGDGILLVADRGTAGHYNRAIDAGETVSITVPLRNTSDVPFRSTSGFLQTTDPFVVVDTSEVVYTERSVIDGETITFAPGSTIVPSQQYTFTVLDDCPDGHEVELEILVWDSDQGRFAVPFRLVVHNVGPLSFGTARIDDDVPGPSQGNDNGIIEPGEIIEYVLAIENRGAVRIDEITARLFSPETLIQFTSGNDVLRYREIAPRSERPIAASFTFAVSDDQETMPGSASLRLFAQGTARGFNYSWLRTQVYQIGVSDADWNAIVEQIPRLMEEASFGEIIDLLTQERLQYRIEQNPQIALQLAAAQQAAEEQLQRAEVERQAAQRAELERQAAQRAAQERLLARLSLSTVLVEGGTFQMGSPSGGVSDERPVHPVTVDSFGMTRTEVTFAEFDAFARATNRSLPDDEGWGRGTRPVINVSWYDAVRYANWLSEQDGLTPAYRINGDSVTWTRSADGWRLPTEAEWEYAARGGVRARETVYAGSNSAGSVAWYDANSGSRTYPVGQKQPNELGLYDMSGNVAELCWDWYGGYSSRSQMNPGGPSSGTYLVARGGGWGSSASHVRVAYRGNAGPDERDGILGFRLVVPAVQ
jgi:formylglycine-generating enzyme required for sulfatase activity